VDIKKEGKNREIRRGRRKKQIHGGEMKKCAREKEERSRAMKGKIHLYMGPMFSGKTSEIIRQYTVMRLGLSKKEDARPILFIRNARDTRYSVDSASTHDGLKLRDCESVVAVTDLRDAISKAEPCSHVFIDEGQLFKGLRDICISWARSGKKVVISCLDAHADHPKHSPWEEITDIIPYASKIVKLTVSLILSLSSSPQISPSEKKIIFSFYRPDV
jgi:thymidine kinase